MRRHLQLRYLAIALALAGLSRQGAAVTPSAPGASGASAAAAVDSERTRLRLYVTEYQVGADSPIDAPTANGILAARMGRLGEVFGLVTHEEAKQLLSHEALLQLLGSDSDSAALVRLGEAIAADRLLHGKLGKVGETYVATLTLFDLRTGVVEKRVAGTFRGAADLAIARLNEQADQMLAYLFRSYAPDQLDASRKVGIKLSPRKRRPAAAGPTWLDVAGAGLAGAGVGIAAGGGVAHAAMRDDIPVWVPVAMYVAGGTAAVVGGVLLVLPSGEPAPE